MLNKYIILLVLLFAIQASLFAQVTVPMPCTSPPNGVGCLCSTAGLLCTPDLLDGFTYSMSSTPNEGGLPSNDLCPPVNGIGGIPNNVNWFSFIAWCTDLTMEITLTNCNRGTQGGNTNDWGVQLAVFESCGSPWDPVECITETGAACGNDSGSFPTFHTIVANGLTIGNTYYFMMDGCNGSYCDVSVNVVGTCGTGMIDPWTTGLDGPLETCVGNTDTYTAEDLNGAVEFYYYLEGVQIATGTELLSTDITWTTAGTYQLCVDVSNLPCILESDDPLPDCITIEVCPEADAGAIQINPNPACPNEIVAISVGSYESGTGMDQYLIITDNSGMIIQVVAGDMTTFTWDDCETFNVYSYNVKTGGTVPIVGMNFPADFPCNDSCCDIEMDVLSFEDNNPPVFDNPPQAMITYTCLGDVPPMVDQDWTDDCVGPGTAVGAESGTFNLCNGGTIIRDWEAVDSCDNSILLRQTITVDPVPVATIINPPANETVTCDMIPTSAPDLMYSNGGLGVCDISGVLMPMTTGSADLCGGQLVNEWMTVDACGRTISHIQTISVTPVPPPVFINPPPATITVACDAIPTTAPDLMYTNSESGACEISGMESPTMTGSADECGGTIVWTWTYTDQCGTTIMHTQTVTVIPTPPAAFVNPPPSSVTVACDAIPTTAPDLMYTNGETGVCEISGPISPVMSGAGTECGGTIVFTWDFVDKCGRPINHTQTVTITPIPEASFINTPPSTLTVNCDAIPTTFPDLDYTNGETGGCEISGIRPPMTTDNSSPCGGNIINVWQFTDQCGRPINFTQTITVTPAPQGTYLNPPADITVDCDQVPNNPPDLMLNNGELGVCLIEATVPGTLVGTPTACGGTVQFEWTHVDQCGRITPNTQNITINPASIASFSTPPADITVDCNSIPAGNIPLNYTNGESGFCQIAGFVNSSRSGSTNECGGTLMDIWSFVDACGRVINESRTITVNPAPPATFASLPGMITVACIDEANIDLILVYSNGESSPCLIEGTANAVVTGTFDNCGGTLLHTWTFTDACGRNINHSRDVIILPAPDPVFVNPPNDITVACGDTYDPPSSLEYTNGLFNPCLISGFASTNTTISGNIMTNEWSFDNLCDGVLVIHTQTVVFTETPDISIDPNFGSVCEGDPFDLSLINVTDANNTNPTITYHDGSPPNNNNETNPIVYPTGTSLYSIKATSGDGCNDYEDVLIYVTEPNLAGDDVSITICKDGNTLDLDTYLSSDASTNGYWSDEDNTGIDVNNPNAVNINNIPPGTYNLYYITFEIDECPSDEAILTLTILDEVDYTITDVSCSLDNSTYSITIVTNGNVVTSTAGTVNVIDQNNTEVINIPIGTQTTLTVSDPNSSCDDERIINSPNCDCPDIAAPIGTPTYKICVADVPLTMTVMVEAGLSANWYDSQAGLVLLASLTLSFDHTNPVPGIYNYYVEAIDPTTDCVSQDRFKIEVEVVTNPTAVDVNPMICDDNLDGFVAFDLVFIGNTINSNPNNIVIFYVNQADANLGMNPLASPYTNTSSDQVIYAVVENPTGCRSQAIATLTVLDLPTFNLVVNNENCLGDGLGDVQISDVIGNGNVTTSINNNAFNSTLIYDSLQVASYSLEVMDTAGCISTTMFDVTDGIELIVETFALDCDNKGTLSDATDDDYALSFTINNNLNIAGQFILFINNIEIGRYDYGTLSSITLLADGSNIDIRFEDVDTGCSVNRLGGPLNPCSTTCILTIDDLVFECDNNGSDDNPLDDFYTVTINVSSINGSSANTYSLFVDGVLRGAGMYGEDFTFIVNATTADVLINIQDSADSQCQISTTLDALDPCSNGCAVLLSIIDIECDNNGTILDKDDDIYNIRILADAINTGSNTYNLNIDQALEGVYAYGDTIDLVLNADGVSHLLTAIDTNRPDCFAEANTGLLNNCSTDCQIDITASIPVCNNNGTNDDELDDTYTFTIQLAGGQGNGWSNSDLAISGNYGEQITIGPLLIADGPIILTFVDDDINECVNNITITPPNPCSGCNQTMSLSVDGIIDCDNPSAPIEAMVSDIGTYLWTFQGGEVSTDLATQAGSEGFYVFTVVFPDNCSLTDSVFVDSDDDIPVANGGGDKLINCKISSVTLVGDLSTQGPNITYEWTDEAGNILGTDLELDITTPGDYFLQVFDSASNCKSAKDRVVVQENIDIPSVAIYANPGEIFDCIIASIILTTDNEPSTSYTWITPEVTFSDVNSINITTPGEYILIATNVVSECIDTGRIQILSFQQYPIIELAAEDILDCEVKSVTISADGSQTGATITYSWYDIDGNLLSQSIGETTVTEPGEYVLVLEDSANGCTNSDTIEIISIENIVGIDIQPIIEVVQGQTIILRPIINIPIEDIDTIIWDPTDGLSCINCLEPTVLVDEDRTYTITIIDIYGCVGSATITIRAKINKDIFVPNIIRPVSGGGNDVFVIYTDDELAIINRVLIYDRWGNKVYQNFNQIPNSPIGAWNGKFNGEPVAQGVYVYLIEAELSTGQRINLSGDITVLR